MDLKDPELYEYEQKREERRFRLVEGIKSEAEAVKVFEAAKAKERKAEETERKRQAKAKERLKELAKESQRAHAGIEFAKDCKRNLIAEYVPIEIIKARDVARAAANKAARELHKKETALASMELTVRQRDPKMIEGTLRDVKGEAKRGPSVNGRPGPRLKGPIPNPYRWRSKEERKYFMEKIDEAQLAVVEARAASDAAEKKYVAAEKKVGEAYEDAFNGPQADH